MRTVRLLFGVVSVMLLVLGMRATQAQQLDPRLPVGPNRELVNRVCTSCHDIGNLVATSGRSREGWDSKIDDMVLYGLKVTADQRKQILDYLATYLPP